jgi:glutamate racemase
MIGILDSGVGGLTALRELRTLLPREDLIYLADTKNCPYGKKSREELLPIVEGNIDLLTAMGAEVVLMACCTASTLYPYLDAEKRKRAVPIIAPAAERVGEFGRVTVIATEHTVASGAFTKEITERYPHTRVTEIAAQRLVSLVEDGLSDGAIDARGDEYLTRLTERIKESAPDALILGCTHFSHLERELGRRLPSVKTVSPAREGARLLTKVINERVSEDRSRQGRLTYLATRDK